MIEKRKQPFVVTWFILSILFLIFFIVIIFVSIYPSIKELESEKEKLWVLVNNYQDIKSRWITYDDFNELKTEKSLTLYLQNILNEIDDKFFVWNFENTKWWDYASFIEKKTAEINSKINSDDYKNSVDLYKKVLPAYVEVGEKDDVWIMTDFKFVNYLEIITRTFNLSTKNKSVTVWNLSILADYDSSNTKNSWLDTTIFYIPYDFDVSWTKKDIIDFIYFLENVWSIKYSIDSKKIEMYKDNFLNKKLLWFNSSDILENPIVDIQSINFSDYIDSNPSIVDYNDFKTYIKTTQWDERIDTKISVRFYVKWLPNHKIEEAIKNLADKYEKTKQTYIKAKKDWLWDLNKIEKWLKYLQELDLTIKNIKSAKKDLNNVYKQVIELNKILDKLSIP